MQISVLGFVVMLGLNGLSIEYT